MLAILRQMFALFDRESRLRVAGLMLVMLAMTFLEMLGLGLFLPVLQVLAAPDRIPSLPVVRDVHHWLGSPNPALFLLIMTAGLTVFYAFKNVCLLGLTHAQNHFVQSRMSRFSGRLLRHYLLKPYTFHLQRNSAILYRNVTESVGVMFMSALLPFLFICLDGMLSLGVLVALVLVEPLGTLVSVLVLGGTVGLYYGAFRRRARRWGQRIEGYNADGVRLVNEALAAVKELTVLGRRDHFADAFHTLNIARARLRAIMATTNQAPRMVMETVVVLGMFLVMVVILGTSGDVTEVVPTLGLFGLAALRLMPSLTRFATGAVQIRESAAAIENLAADAEGLSRGDVVEFAARPVARPFGMAVTLADVDYRYPGSETPSLEGVNLTIRKGEVIGLVGSSGAGKSTLVDVLLGLLTPTAGRLLVDGEDAAADLAGWQRTIGYVPQSIFLFDDTVRRNVAPGLRDDEIDEERLARAIRLARLDAVVADLPQGLDTPLGERGVRLSGGQRQRVGIARALYHDPSVLVMDEATSALDNETEGEITRAIQDLRGDKTMVLVAHRLTTIRHADRLVFMANGRIADTGTYDELSARNEDFRRMARLPVRAG